MTHPAISLCTGVGELDHAVHKLAGTQTVVYAEADPHASTVLAHRMPGIPNLGDITTIDWRQVQDAHRPRTLIAGWPCQGISNNGHRLGLDDPRSGLWRNVAAAVRELEPDEVYLENVAALRRRGLDVVSDHLNRLGYDLYWTITRAGDVGAAHTRPRFLGYAIPGHGVTVEVPAPPALYSPARLLPTPKASDGPNGGPNQRDGKGGWYLPAIAWRLDEDWRAPELGPEHDYAEAIHRWGRIVGRPAPAPASLTARGDRRISPDFTDWLMGYPAGLTDRPGIPRSQRIKLGGNGVVALQGVTAYTVLRAAARTRLPLAA
ncbi:DNA cytosine methyltransferase [Streptomyces sp. NRRL S-1022]|uniref:DNA cytosine methyltransferase n=1 Tax=Streptomyces sp. NRRL S-1022 TaxID=1463880 RepID=UPI0004BF88C8|nr:DNA cytosine methyltransferase [Streptomyces sp. NRRL S-1022]